MKVYIAGPYSKGDIAINVRNAIEVASKLRDIGHTPFCPHLTHFWHILYPREYKDWLDLDLEWLECCDAMLRLPGESSGADGEEERAKELDIPVYYSIGELIKSAPKGG